LVKAVPEEAGAIAGTRPAPTGKTGVKSVIT